MKTFTKDNYINIQGWMVTDLGLAGNELICYAVIYGFSQDGESQMTGGLSYLESCMNVSRQGVIKILKKLLAKELIKREENITDCKRVFYYVNKDYKGYVNRVNQGYVNKVDKPPINIKTLNNKESDREKPQSEVEQKFIIYMQKEYPHVCKMKKPLTYDEYMKLIKAGYKADQIASKLDVLENRDDYIRKYRSPYLCVRNWLKEDYKKVKS